MRVQTMRLAELAGRHCCRDLPEPALSRYLPPILLGSGRRFLQLHCQHLPERGLANVCSYASQTVSKDTIGANRICPHGVFFLFLRRRPGFAGFADHCGRCVPAASQLVENANRVASRPVNPEPGQ